MRLRWNRSTFRNWYNIFRKYVCAYQTQTTSPKWTKMSLVSNNLHCHSTTHFECCSMRVSTVCILWRSIYAFALLLEMLFFLPLMALIVAFSVCIFFVPWIEWKMMFAIFPNLAFVKYGCIIKAKIVTKLKKTERRIPAKMNSLKSNAIIWCMTFFSWIIRLYCWSSEWIFGECIQK